MKRKLMIIGMLILVVLFGFIVSNNRQETDLDMELARIYSKGYSDGYKARQQDLEHEAEAWQKRYFYMIEREAERWKEN